MVCAPFRTGTITVTDAGNGWTPEVEESDTTDS